MKHQMIFIPTYGKDADFVFHAGKLDIPVKDKINVIVFTPEELKMFMIEYGNSPYKVEQFLKSKGYE